MEGTSDTKEIGFDDLSSCALERVIVIMSTSTQTKNRREATSQNSSAETVVGFAVLGLLVAGAVGVVKALNMESGSGVLLCLLSSVAAFGSVYYIYYGRR